MSNYKNRNNNKTTVNGGVGFTGLLTIAFIVLKLLDVINWSWIWVLSPIWISIALVIGILAIVIGGTLIAAFIGDKKKKKRDKK